MKKLILFTFLFLVIGSTTFAQCKPDKVTKDKMTKEELSFWGVEIVKRTLGNKLLMDMNTTFPSIVSLVGKSGDKYFIKFNVIVIEKSGGRAQFNSPFQGSKSSEVVLGFKEGGEPVKLHFDDVYNNQEITIDKDYMYTVSLTAYLDKKRHAVHSAGRPAHYACLHM
mgnify:CR=1 FL=1